MWSVAITSVTTVRVPYGLTGETIPLAARIFAVVDVLDAMTTTGPIGARARSLRLSTSCTRMPVSSSKRVVDAALKISAGAPGRSARLSGLAGGRRRTNEPSGRLAVSYDVHERELVMAMTTEDPLFQYGGER